MRVHFFCIILSCAVKHSEDPSEWEIGNPRVLASGFNHPEGPMLDSEGNLYVAHFGGSAIHVFSSNGSTKRIIRAPGSKPSNVEFAGEDLRTLYVTENETKAVYRTRVEVPGAILSYPVKKKISNLERIGE